MNHGGKRENAGRKKEDPTLTTSFRIPATVLKVCREHYGRTLNNRVNELLTSLAEKI